MPLIPSVLAEAALTLSPLILAVLLRAAVDVGRRTLSRRRRYSSAAPTATEPRRAA